MQVPPVHRIMVLAAACLLAGCEPSPQVDHYILALSWQPAFCEANAQRPECAELDDGDFAAANLVLHGLWPNAADGDHPFYCGVMETDRDADTSGAWCALPEAGADAETRRDLAEVMPGSRSCLDRHEWIKHGTCSGLDGDAYFDLSARLVRDVAATHLAQELRAQTGGQVALRRLLQAFEEDFGPGAARALEVTCRRSGGVAYLAEIRLALRRDAIDQPLSRAGLFLDGPAPRGGCPGEIAVDRAD